MILLGPGGTTALDLWIDGDRFRFAVPAIDLRQARRRGDAARRDARPAGRLPALVAAPPGRRARCSGTSARRGGDRFVLRDGAAIVDLRAADDGRRRGARARPGSARRRASRAARRRGDGRRPSGIGCADGALPPGVDGLDVDGALRGRGDARAPNPTRRSPIPTRAEGARP